jgi:uncharacterized membrane protein YeaQ/YmgE (transglycosylase-associated protein family)
MHGGAMAERAAFTNLKHGSVSSARQFGIAKLFRERTMGIIWTIIIGFIAGVIAKFIMPGSNEPSGFVLTAILGIVGAIVASYLGQMLGWYAPGEGAGLIGAVVGAIVVLFVWGMIAKPKT